MLEFQELVTVATLLDSREWIVEQKRGLLPQDCSWHVIVCATPFFFNYFLKRRSWLEIEAEDQPSAEFAAGSTFFPGI